MDNCCVMCGTVIPEGSQVCLDCINKINNPEKPKKSSSANPILKLRKHKRFQA